MSKAAKAIELCECLQQWDMYVRTAKVEGVRMLKERMRASLTESMNRCLTGAETTMDYDPKRGKVLFEALQEWDEPEFLEYLNKKTGNPMTNQEKCEAIVRKMVELANKHERVAIEQDMCNWTATLYIGDSHTHVGVPGDQGSFEILVDNLYNSLHGGPGLSFYKPE